LLSITRHADRMDAIYRTQRHVYDLTRKYYLLGRDALIRDLAPPPGGTILEIGCGTGRNLIAAARAWPETQLYGFDISAAMLDTARGAIRRAGLANRITLAQGDAGDFDPQALFGRARFDRAFLSYTLSMIPAWQDAIAHAAAVAERVHIVDFGQQERLPTAFRRGLFAWLGRFHVTPRAALHDEARTVAARHQKPVSVDSLHRGYAWRAVLG
jgi:S-adenosylmethionine-diacylgycerolhomoserine-N-methlytransferase